MHDATKTAMRTIIILIFLCFNFQFILAQNDKDYSFEICFSTNFLIKYNNQSIGPEHHYKIEKLQSSCKFENIEYRFLPKDSLLLNYFFELDSIFSQDSFNIYFNKSCQPDHPEIINETNILDGIITSGYFKSTHSNHSFSITDGICLYNSYYNRILDRFFNIAYYLIDKADPKLKIPETKLISLNSDIEATGFSSLRRISSDPNTYRLK
jgi:hypothetical protein